MRSCYFLLYLEVQSYGILVHLHNTYMRRYLRFLILKHFVLMLLRFLGPIQFPYLFLSQLTPKHSTYNQYC